MYRVCSAERSACSTQLAAAGCCQAAAAAVERSGERSVAAAGFCQLLLLLWSAPKSAPQSLVVDWRALQRPPGYSDIERAFRALRRALFSNV